jgi:hypothetical protein
MTHTPTPWGPEPAHRPLLLTRIEPEGPDFDLRMYYCAFCRANETVIANI